MPGVSWTQELGPAMCPIPVCLWWALISTRRARQALAIAGTWLGTQAPSSALDWQTWWPTVSPELLNCCRDIGACW